MDLSGPGIDVKLKERKKESPLASKVCFHVLHSRLLFVPLSHAIWKVEKVQNIYARQTEMKCQKSAHHMEFQQSKK